MSDPSIPPSETAPTDHPSGGPPRVLAASLYCENCGRTTVHRILRWDRRSVPGSARTSGIARCRTCDWTHPFDIARASEVEVPTIVSRRSESVWEVLSLRPHTSLVVGETFASPDGPLRIHRIDLRTGESSDRAAARDVATLWVTRDEGLSVPVSIIEGARTRSTRWSVDPGALVSVDEEIVVDGLRLLVTALRARGHTWRRPGDQFRAEQLQRVYGRRIASPPAGRRDWRSVRERPRSRTSSFSRTSRSRSGPGVRTTRTVPRARSAAGGATHQRDSPS